MDQLIGDHYLTDKLLDDYDFLNGTKVLINYLLNLTLIKKKILFQQSKPIKIFNEKKLKIISLLIIYLKSEEEIQKYTLEENLNEFKRSLLLLKKGDFI